MAKFVVAALIVVALSIAIYLVLVKLMARDLVAEAEAAVRGEV